MSWEAVDGVLVEISGSSPGVELGKEVDVEMRPVADIWRSGRIPAASSPTLFPEALLSSGLVAGP
jgi:hypothetical protein